MELIKKLCLYSLDCIQSTQKNSSFLNLKKADLFPLSVDNSKLIELKTKQALNKNTMTLLYGGCYWITDNKKINTPLLYTDFININNDNGKMSINIDYDNLQFNYNVISSLINNDYELIEFIVNELSNLTDLKSVDFKGFLNSLIKLSEEFEIVKDEKLIFCKIPDDNSGLIKELKEITKEY